MTESARAGGAAPTDAPRFAYLLMTHTAPERVEELSSRILDLTDSGQVVVHHDLAAESVPWGGQPPIRTHLVERSPVLWGDWSIVQAALRMVRYAFEVLDADWYVMLSGEHRPVVPLAAWERATMASGSDAFIQASLLPPLHFGRSDEDANRFMARCAHKWTTISQPSSSVVHRALGGVWKASRYVQPLYGIEYSHRRRAWFIGTPRRRGSMQRISFYKGSQWIAFNRRSAQAILRADPAVTKWFSRGHIPDETYLQTLLKNEPDLIVKDQVVTYVPEGPPHPVPYRWMLLTLEDLDDVRRSGAAFARKVDPDDRQEVIDAIDAYVDECRNVEGETSTPTA